MANKLDLVVAEDRAGVSYLRHSSNYPIDMLRIEVEVDGDLRQRSPLYQHLESGARRYFKGLLVIEDQGSDPAFLVVYIDPNNTSPLYLDAVRCLLGDSLIMRINDWIKELMGPEEDTPDLIDGHSMSIISNEEAQMILDRIAREI